MKRIIIKLFAVVMAVLTFSGLAWAQAWNHDPASPIGPFHWGAVTPSFATCGDSITGQVGMKQSPIDIVPFFRYQDSQICMWWMSVPVGSQGVKS
jgi:carbonic anhydrase